MLQHLEELNTILEKYGISKDEIFIVGGGVLAIKGIRPNVDIDFSLINSQTLNKIRPKKFEGKYVQISKNVDCYFDRYKDLGICDKDVIENKFYFIKNGYKFVLPEIEIAYRMTAGKINDSQHISKIEKYILQAKEWDWDFLKKLLQEYYKKDRPKDNWIKSQRVVRLISLAKKPKDAKKALKYVYRKARTIFCNAVFFVRPNTALQGQLRTKMAASALLGNHFKAGAFFRYDVLMKYLTIDAILKNDNEFLKQYNQMQKKRAEIYTLEDFRRLVYSIKEKGFLNSYPIPISKNGQMIEGSHRLACALHFNIEEVPVIVSGATEGGYYGMQWFLTNGFNKKTIELLEETKHRLFIDKGIYFPVIIWPPVQNYFKEIAKHIKSRYKTVFEKEIVINKDFNNFTEKIYEVDDIAKWKVGLKRHLMKDFTPKIYFMLLEVPNPCFRPKRQFNSYLSRQMEDLKKEIRNKYKNYIENYFYDIVIHIGDNYEHNRGIIQIIQALIDLNANDIKESP